MMKSEVLKWEEQTKSISWDEKCFITMLKSHLLNTYRHALANNYFLAKVFNDFREIMNRISAFCYEVLFRKKKQNSQFISLPIANSSYENQPTECSSRLTYWVESERTTVLNSSFFILKPEIGDDLGIRVPNLQAIYEKI